MNTKILTVGVAFLLAAGSMMAAEGGQRYASGDFSVDLYGSGSIGKDTIDRLSGARIERDVRLGAGVGLNYFLTQHVGIGAEGFSESTSGRFVDNAFVSVILRLPIGDTGFAPYAFGGGGRQFDPLQFWNAHLGGGVEYRFNTTCGLFVDGRYVMGDGGRNFGLGRGGIRFRF